MPHTYFKKIKNVIVTYINLHMLKFSRNQLTTRHICGCIVQIVLYV